MEVVAVERELGSGQGDIMIRTSNSKIIVIILGHLALVMMLPSLPGIGSDVVLTPGNFQAYPELFSFLPARASEQGNVIGSVRIYITEKPFTSK